MGYKRSLNNTVNLRRERFVGRIPELYFVDNCFIEVRLSDSWGGRVTQKLSDPTETSARIQTVFFVLHISHESPAIIQLYGDGI